MVADLGKVLLLTIGTGNKDRVRETLLDPLIKSIRQGSWQRVVLLPSQATQDTAFLLKEELQDVSIDVRPLPGHEDEENADACFAHFDNVIGELRAAGFLENDILVDFTRGTKAMSAALVLAAVRHDLSTLRYISSDRRDERGAVVPGGEIVAEVRTTVMLVRKRLDDALRFFKYGDFAAVLHLLPDPESPFSQAWPGDVMGLVRQIRPMAEFYGAWDRLDYAAAERVVIPADPPPEWARFMPTRDMRRWVSQLAQPLPAGNREKATHVRRLVLDLLANGERRIRDRQYEDAVLRAYRVLELVGQIRLFDHDLDSGSLPPEHHAVQALQAKLKSSGSTGLGWRKDGQLQAGRMQVARLLIELGDPLGRKLLALGDEGVLKVKVRNDSILTHGFGAIGVSEDQYLHEVYKKLEDLVNEDGGADTTTSLRIARSLDLFFV